jgi:uncharacterized protein (TIGR00730 family)
MARKPDCAPPLSFHDDTFVDCPAARPLRILAEYLDPLTRLRRAGVGDTIVMFGSARIQSPERARRHLAALKRTARKNHGPDYRESLRHARSTLEMSHYYEDARELARRITAWARTLGEHPRRFVICSGGGPGIMEAANRGALDAGGSTMGLSIQLPHEQCPNAYITPELNFYFHYFFMRKLWFAQLAKALIVFPGGFGTMDELWEMLTLMQTHKLPPQHMILIYGRAYWDKVLNWKEMMRTGTISRQEYDVLEFADTVDEAFERITSGLEKNHLRLDNEWTG